MNGDDFEERMRRFEWFHSLRVPLDSYIILRMDGKGFTKLTADLGFEKPFDGRFHQIMLHVAERLMGEFAGTYAFTESDEISVLLPKGFDLFSREVEKLVSISAAKATSAFVATVMRDFGPEKFELAQSISFDSRIWFAGTRELVADYFMWRAADAVRCGLNSWAYWTLRHEGKTCQQATSMLKHQSIAFKNELLFQRGINFNDLPAWHKRGMGLYFTEYEKQGFNPKTGEKPWVKRRRMVSEQNLPMGSDYAHYVLGIVERAERDEERTQGGSGGF